MIAKCRQIHNKLKQLQRRKVQRKSAAVPFYYILKNGRISIIITYVTKQQRRKQG